jgi:hypothetical protein
LKKTFIAATMWLAVAGCAGPEEDVAAKLQHFYSWYISTNDTLKTGKVSADTLEKYITTAYRERIASDSELDYDPLLSAQDYDKKWVKTLTISKATAGREKIYRVSFLIDEKEKISHNIVVTMNKEHGEWKIDYVEAN